MERKEAIEVIKKNWPDSSFTMLREALETLVPELKENDDERIRKEIIDHISNIKSTTISDLREKQFDSWIAWLEKKSENGVNCDDREIPNTWKPSEEQLIAIDTAINVLGTLNGKQLIKLQKDLRKLKR